MMRTAVIALAVLLAVAACGSATSNTVAPTATTPPQPSEPASPSSVPPAPSDVPSGEASAEPSPLTDDPQVAAAKQQLESADLADAASIDAIGGSLRFTRTGEESSRQVLENATAVDVLWAALWVYASSGTDPEPVRPLLTHADPSLRIMSAGILVALGDPSGFGALTEALADESVLLGSNPPRSIQAYALGIAVNYVDAPGEPAEPGTEDEIAAALGDWSGWLAENSAGLQFDQSTGLWGLP